MFLLRLNSCWIPQGNYFSKELIFLVKYLEFFSRIKTSAGIFSANFFKLTFETLFFSPYLGTFVGKKKFQILTNFRKKELFQIFRKKGILSEIDLF